MAPPLGQKTKFVRCRKETKIASEKPPPNLRWDVVRGP